MAFFGLFSQNSTKIRQSSFSSPTLPSFSSCPTPASPSTAISSSLSFSSLYSSQLVTDTINILKSWRGEDEKSLYSIEEIFNAIQEALHLKEEKRKWKIFFKGISFLIIFLFFVSSIICTIFAMQWIKDQRVNNLDVLVNAKDGNPLRVQEYYSYIPVHAMRWLDFDKIEKMESLVLQWGNKEEENERKFYFKILSAFKNGKDKTTTLHLSSNYKLIIFQDTAILYNEKNEEVGELKMPLLQQSEEKEKEEFEKVKNELENEIYSEESSLPLSSSPSFFSSSKLEEKSKERKEENSSSRRLGNLRSYLANDNGPGRYPQNIDAGPPLTAFDSYCRYGCGGLAVTFPYYYRPFFGYGYPLVGTESMFPAGYGGYPAAPLLASQGGVPMIGSTAGPVFNGGMNTAATSSMTRTVQGGLENLIPVSLPLP